MVLSADKERLKALLKDTITLLCRNGLAFKSKFSIEALIGVTLDEDDIFLISINELIQTELNNTLDESQSCNDEASEESSVSDGESALVKHHRTRKRRRAKLASIKLEPLVSDIADQNNDPEQDDTGDGEAVGGDSALEDQSAAKKPHTDNDAEDGRNDAEDDDSKDIVFIKQEIDTWSNNTPSTIASNSSFPGASASQGNMNFSLSDMNLVPISSHDETGMMWQSNTQQPLTYRRHSSTTTTSSVQQPGDIQMSGQQPQQISSLTCAVCGTSFPSEHQLIFHPCPRLQGSYRYSCQFCGKRFNSTGNLRGHLAVHTGQKEFRCHVCDKEFAYKSTLLKHVKTTHGLES